MEVIPLNGTTEVLLDNVLLTRNSDSMNVKIGVVLAKPMVIVANIVEFKGLGMWSVTSFCVFMFIYL